MTQALNDPPLPLTTLSEEEQLFVSSLGEFAAKEIGPHVAEMDRSGVFKPDLIRRFFEQGFMGIEVPEALGGSGGTFFLSVLAVETLARVDASAAVIVDVQNTLVNNALLRWGTDEQKKNYLPRLATDTVGAYALSEGRVRQRRFRARDAGRGGWRFLPAQRTETLDHERAPKPASSSSLPPSTASSATRG